MNEDGGRHKDCTCSDLSALVCELPVSQIPSCADGRWKHFTKQRMLNTQEAGPGDLKLKGERRKHGQERGDK